jgi:hypothetical protein
MVEAEDVQWVAEIPVERGFIRWLLSVAELTAEERVEIEREALGEPATQDPADGR